MKSTENMLNINVASPVKPLTPHGLGAQGEMITTVVQ